MATKNELWVDKYSPKNLDEYLLYPELKETFKSMLKNSLQNMTFCGIQGSGKTTLAKILCKESHSDILFVPCAVEGTIDNLRYKVSEFCNAMAAPGKMKVVLLDEIDSASSSGDSNFQKGLRNVIESAQDDTRFILTCNYRKILPAILSRCPEVPLGFGKADLLFYCKKILDNEKISYSKENLKEFVEKAFKFYPDCRRILGTLQICCLTGTLIPKICLKTYEQETAASDFLRAFADEAVSRKKDILEIRKLYLSKKALFPDYITASSELFSYSLDKQYLKTSDDILRFSEMIYELNCVADKEPIFFGLLALLRKISEKYAKE